MKTNTAERLRQLMDERGLRQIDILEKAKPFMEKFGVKLSKTDISQYLSGKVTPRQDKLTVLGHALDVSEPWLMGYDVSRSREGAFSASDIPPGFQPMPEMDFIPLVGRIACGEPITAEENCDGVVGVPAEWRATFTLRCEGDSMAPSIQDGDLVAIRKQPDVEQGQIAAVRIDGEATLKRVYKYADHIILQPENGAYAPIMLAGESLNTVSIEGRAVGLCRGL